MPLPRNRRHSSPAIFASLGFLNSLGLEIDGIEIRMVRGKGILDRNNQTHSVNYVMNGNKLVA